MYAGGTGSEVERVPDLHDCDGDVVGIVEDDLLLHEDVGAEDGISLHGSGGSGGGEHIVTDCGLVDLYIELRNRTVLHVSVVSTHWYRHLDKPIGSDGVGQLELNYIVIKHPYHL